MTKIYLIRHAEAEGNLYRIAQGQQNSLITDRGFRQIAALKKRFADIPVDAVYSSDLYRTCVTATAVYLPKGLPLRTCPELREICVGDWEGRTWGEIARTDSQQMQDFSLHLDRWHVDGAETPQQVLDRMLAAVRRIAGENPGRTVAVFSHGCSIRILLAALQGYSIAQMGETPLGSNTAVSLLEGDGDGLRVVFRDDVTHLTPELLRRHSSRTPAPKPLDPGLYFRPLQPEQEAWMLQCVRNGWADAALPEPYTDAAARRLCLSGTAAQAGILEGQPVGLLQFDSARDAAEGRGWISLLYVQREQRGRGYGVQLLGQSVQHYRPLGRRSLCVALAAENAPAVRFFEEYGFFKTEERLADGRAVWEKDISFRPLESYR